MKITLLGAAALMALPAFAREPQGVVVDDTGRTHRVEVVATDVPGRTITYRSPDGRATMTVAEPAMGTLRHVRPGDTIDLTLRDNGGVPREVVAIVQDATASPTLAPGTTKTIASTRATNLVTIAPATPVATVIRVDDGTGAGREYAVDDQAVVRFRPLRSGEKVLVSWRYSPNGEPEAVVRIAHSENGASGEIVTTAPGTVSVLDSPAPDAAAPTYSVDGEIVQVVSADLRARTLTVRSANGDVRTLPVASRAMDGLRSVREGDSVTLSTTEGRVVLISRP